MDQEKKVYLVQCTRCRVGIESHTQPAPKMTAFLCNSCHLLWKDIENKMLHHAYEDEMRKAFIDFMNSLPYLKNQTLRGF